MSPEHAQIGLTIDINNYLFCLAYDWSQACLSAVPVPVLTVSPEPTPTANAPSVQSNCTDTTNSCQFCELTLQRYEYYLFLPCLAGDGCSSAISVPPDASATENAA